MNQLKLFHWQQRRRIAAYLMLKKRQKIIYRSVGTCEIFKLRKQQGAYHNLVQEMRFKNERKFRNYHRMYVENIDILVEKLSPHISEIFHTREPIAPAEMVSVTLRYLAAGMSMRSISYLYRLGLTTVSNIIKNMCCAIWEVLKPEYLPIPRRVIENTFGILVAKWRILERPIIAKLETAEKSVGALVCLHNFLKKSDLHKADNEKYCPYNYVDRETETGEIILGEWRNQLRNGTLTAGRMGGNTYARGASVMRSVLSDYFMHKVPIDPQWSK